MYWVIYRCNAGHREPYFIFHLLGEAAPSKQPAISTLTHQTNQLSSANLMCTRTLQTTSPATATAFLQARRQPRRGPGNQYREGPNHNPIPYAPRSRHRSSPVRSGAEPLPKMDFVHIWGQKEAIWNTLFSIFERYPPNVAGPGKTFPFFLPCRRGKPGNGGPNNAWFYL